MSQNWKKRREKETREVERGRNGKQDKAREIREGILRWFPCVEVQG